MKELYADTYAALDGGVRIFLLVGRERALLIDAGMSGLDCRALAAQHTDLPLSLLVTHADRDHIAGSGAFDELYLHPSEAAFYYGAQGGGGTMLPVFDGDVIDLGGRAVEIVHLPGHTPGSVTALDRANRALIGGDPIQEDGNIYMFGPQRDLRAYIASLERLDRRGDFDRVYPSHAKEEVGRGAIPRLIEGAKKILAGEIRGEEIKMRGKRIRSCDAGVSRFLCEAEPV